jgi:ketosteroid isomerase-like protein
MQWLAVGGVLLSLACGARYQEHDVKESDVIDAVRARMASFERAERERDAERLLSHFADVPGFRVFNDGQALQYPQLAAAVRSTFPTLRSLEGGFADLEIRVLGPEYALATATFRETVTDSTGAAQKSRGAVSWLWRHVGSEWRIVYGQVDHRPDSE